MTLDGRIVEYLENGKFICAFVYEDVNNRLRLFNQNSREVTLPRNRIVHCTDVGITPPPSRNEAVAVLQKTAERRNGLADTINLDEIWEIVSERPEDVFEVVFLCATDHQFFTVALSSFWGYGNGSFS